MAEPLGRAFLWIVVSYLAALAVAVPCVIWAREAGYSPLWAAAIADVAATVVIYLFGLAFRNASFYDPYWSVIPPFLAAYLMWMSGGIDLRGGIAWFILLYWAIRLTANWARGWQGLGHEDWRYVDLRAQTGVFYQGVNFLGIHLFPTVLVFAGCLPFIAIGESDDPMGFVDALATLVGIGAVSLEWKADEELKAFRRSAAGQGRVLDTGVWRWCRHPNYCGEIGFWLSMGLFGFAASGELWVFSGFGLMVILFVGITIPMIERRQAANKPAYAEYRRSTAMLLPRFWK
jgi:steroid 5-alpha reductase family enzyme